MHYSSCLWRRLRVKAPSVHPHHTYTKKMDSWELDIYPLVLVIEVETGPTINRLGGHEHTLPLFHLPKNEKDPKGKYSDLEDQNLIFLSGQQLSPGRHGFCRTSPGTVLFRAILTQPWYFPQHRDAPLPPGPPKPWLLQANSGALLSIPIPVSMLVRLLLLTTQWPQFYVNWYHWFSLKFPKLSSVWWRKNWEGYLFFVNFLIFVYMTETKHQWFVPALCQVTTSQAHCPFYLPTWMTRSWPIQIKQRDQVINGHVSPWYE